MVTEDIFLGELRPELLGAAGVAVHEAADLVRRLRRQPLFFHHLLSDLSAPAQHTLRSRVLLHVAIMLLGSCNGGCRLLADAPQVVWSLLPNRARIDLGRPFPITR